MISPELKFLLGCVRIDSVADRSDRLRVLVPLIEDWSNVLYLANLHGVIPLMYVHLKETIWDELPLYLREDLEAAHRRNASHALSLTGELLRLLRLLQEHHIPALPYKGPILAIQLYGDVAMRQFGDLDVAINAADVPAAARLMVENGWNADFSHSEAQEKIHLQKYKDYYFYSRNGSLRTELHWKFADSVFGFSLSVADVQQRSSTIEVSGARILTPLPEDLLLMLCFHGAMHIWERISWLTDIAQLLNKYPEVNWNRVVDNAVQFDCQRVLFFSLELVRRFCHAPLPEVIKVQIDADAIALDLAAQAEILILNSTGEEVGLWEKRKFHLLMQDGWRQRFMYRWNNIFRMNEADWKLLPVELPAGLYFLYFPLRILRMLSTYIFRLKPRSS
jgi:Uncharacterised nucleotidyltransferase